MKQRLLALIIGFILSLIVGTIIANAQDKQAETGKDCIKGHATIKEFYDALRILPAKVTSVDHEHKLVYFKFEEKSQIHLGSFRMIPEGSYEPNFYANTDQTFVFLWCSTHYALWQVVKFSPKKK